MDYRRVIPRDLFNESALLHMIGKLWIAVNEGGHSRARFLEEDVDRFEIVQDPSSGAIRVANLSFRVGEVAYLLERPLNARTKWSLWIRRPDDDDFEEVRVFDEEGALSEEMLALMRG